MLTIYSKDKCEACKNAKDLLTMKGIGFTEINCDNDWEGFDFIVSQGLRSFPQIYENGQLYVQGGYQGLLKKLSNNP